MDKRLEQIKRWLENDLACVIKDIRPASKDASFRRYFRVSFGNIGLNSLDTQNSYIVMDAPPEQEDTVPFIKVTTLFSTLDIHVASIYAQHQSLGFLLLEDLGVVPYLDCLNISNADSLYQEAMKVLLKLSIDESNKPDLPLYDDRLLNKEMDLFEQWFVNVHLSSRLSEQDKLILSEARQCLLNNINQQNQVIVHRDYHSRNLMFNKTNNPGVIDYQDAVIGACTYDVASLLRDSYIEWPEDKIDEWLKWYQRQLLDNKIITETDPMIFKQWFDYMGMQRQIKVVGIFSRLYHRDGKENYLNDIPLTYKNLLTTSQKYSELNEFSQLLTHLYEQYEQIK